MIRRLALLLLALLLALPAAPSLAAQARASLNRHSVHMGETVTLSITVEGGGSAQPDFSPLQADFQVLQTSRSSSMQIINGKMSRSQTFGVALQPRHVGTLRIPPLSVGGDTTQALSLTVLPPSTAAEGGPGDDVFVEAELKPDTVYVGQQAVITVRLFYAGQLAGGDLDTPDAGRASVQKLGQDAHYQAQRGGRAYQVVERRYALIAQQPGQLDIPGIGFRGQTGLGGGFGFFNSGRRVTARSPAMHLTVKPEPSTAGDGPWLPARQLELEASGLPDDGQATVGQPLSLELSESAVGLPFEVLPELSLPDIEGAEVYPDKPDTGTADDGQWLRGHRRRTFAIVPTRPGTLVIPAIRVNWWDVRSDQPRQATLPARTLTVQAAAGAPPAPAASLPPPPARAAQPAPPASPLAPEATGGATPMAPHLWRWLAVALLLLWLATIAAWWWRRRRPPRTARGTAPDGAAPASRRAFRHAAATGDAAAISHALLGWARSERPALRNLGELAAALDDAEQQAAIADLERSRYGDGTVAIDGAAIDRTFAEGFHWRRADAGRAARDALPPLYPFGDT